MTQWQPIETAFKDVTEILGSRWAGDGIKTMVKEPFITFWSPTLNKFYCSPTHWIPMPRRPDPDSPAPPEPTP